MSEQRVDIPNHANWPINTLENLCEVVSRGKGPRYVESSSVSAIGQRCITDTGFDGSRSRPHDDKSMGGHLIPASGDVLLNSTGTGTIGRSSVFDGDDKFIVDSHVTVLRPRKTDADPKWLNELLRNPRLQRHLEAYCYTGSTNQLELSRSQLMKASVPTPTYDEQRVVARILDTLDTQVQQTEALIAKLEKVKEGLLHDLLTRGIDENGHLRPSPEQAPELYKESPLGLIPREWEVNKIKDISTKVTNGFVGVATPHYTESQSGAIYLYGNNIRKNRIDLSKHERVTQTFHKSQVKSQLKDGDMLTVQSGHIGTSAVYELSMGEANCHALIITRFAPSLVKSRFASLYLNSKLGMLAQRRLFIGSTILHINTSDLAKLAIPTPSLDEQNRVVEHFEKIEDRLQRETRERDNLVKLKQGLMDDLLTGRVRVTSLLEKAQATPPA